jgi:uncharacterized membrane protein YsdA (DUF1294 family)
VALLAAGLWGLGMLGPNRLGAYLLWLSAASLATFVLYGLDKAQAKRAGLRVPENLLHLMALLGGFPGGFAGRAAFHHKTRKPAFARVLWISLAIHLVVVLGIRA